MEPIEILQLAQSSQTITEEIAEAFIADVMSQLDGLDPSDEGHEIISMLYGILENPDSNVGSLAMVSYLLGCDLSEWLEELNLD